MLVDITASRHVKGAPDAHAGPVQGPGPRLGHVTAAVHLLVVDRVLIVVVRLQGEFGAADRALEATRVEERKVLQGTHPVHLVDGLSAPQTRALVEVGPIHVDQPVGGPGSLFAHSATTPSSRSPLATISHGAVFRSRCVRPWELKASIRE